MILQSLNRYYDILAEDSKNEIPKFGYSSVGVGFALNISIEGELLDVFPQFMKIQSGNNIKDIPRLMIVPEYAEPTVNIKASFLCGKCEYVLGISKRDEEKKEFSDQRFKEFQRLNKELLEQINKPSAKAVVNYLNNFSPKNAKENPLIKPYLNELLTKGRRIVFMYQNKFVHEDPDIKAVWETYFSKGESLEGQCLVTGENLPIAKIHRKLQGNVGKNSFSSPLVSFNQRSFESYNRTDQKGLNAPVSEKAAFKYAAAINYLLSSDNPNKKFSIGDAALIYWAECEKREYEITFAKLIDPNFEEDEIGVFEEDRKKLESSLETIAGKVTKGMATQIKETLNTLGSENPKFFVLGLAPAGDGRLIVRFFINNPFDKMILNIMNHYRDLMIIKESVNQPEYLSIRSVINETVSKKLRDKEASPLLGSAVFQAILTNSPYPAALYYAILNRVRADMDDVDKKIQKINYTRAAIIKAYLIRKYRNQINHIIQEVLTMSLNEESSIPAYLLGRLFAVLEKVQKEANPNLNATIKDRYFTSACANPATVFPVLLRLSQHHISKAEYGYTSEKRIEEILNKLDIQKNPIPKHLTLDDQGVFILGYYHQHADFFTKKTDKNA